MGLVFGGLTGPCDGYLLGAFSSHLPRLLHPHRRRRHRPQASLSQGEVEALVHLKRCRTKVRESSLVPESQNALVNTLNKVFNNLRTHLLMSPSSRRERRSWGCHNNPETADSTESNVSKTCIHIYFQSSHLVVWISIFVSRLPLSVCGVHLICVQMEFNWFREGNLFRQEKCKECQWSTKNWKKEVTAETFPSKPLYTFSIQPHALQTGYLLSFRALKGTIKLYFVSYGCSSLINIY